MNTFLIWSIIFLVIILVKLASRRKAREESPDNEEYPRSILPFSERVRRRMALTSGTRLINTSEFMLDTSSDISTIKILFFVPRRPLEIVISFSTPESATIKSVSAVVSGEAKPLRFGVKYGRLKNESSVRIAIIPATTINRLEIDAENISETARYFVRILCKSGTEPDLQLLSSAFEAMDENRLKSARGLFHNYERYCSWNPAVLVKLAYIYADLKEYPRAEEYALMASAINLQNEGIDMYRQIQNMKDVFLPMDEVKLLREQAGDWPAETHYGVIELKKNQRFLLGLRDYHAKFCCEIMTIRRQSAARMLTRLDFGFDARKEVVLDSRLRILNTDLEAEPVPEENIFFNDSPARNIFITGEEEKRCGWILPDLAVGDIVEWHYSLLCKSRSETSGMFMMTDLNNPYFPTFESKIIFEAPSYIDFKISSRDEPSAKLAKSTGNGGKTGYEIDDSRYLPSKNTGFFYENNFLNPVYACADTNTSWKPIADGLRDEVIGEHFESEPLPEILWKIVDEAVSEEQALEQSFYLIRDKLKYASLPSGLRQLGKKGRAWAIVEAGTGNCNDKSYLLCLLCRELKIPFEIVAISVKDGIIFKNLPAKQFDHVFVRARLNDRWHYMDASDTYSVFGSAPAYSQGLDAMFINGEGSLGIIAEDSVDSNKIVVNETIESINGGWVETALSINSSGHAARSLDESLKSVSLAFRDQNQAAQEALRNLIPRLIVAEFEKTSNTADSNFCNLRCRGKRSPVIPLGDKHAADIRWNLPAAPMAYWRAFVNDKLFVFSYPQTVHLSLTFRGAIFDRLSDISNLAEYSSDICEVSESREKGPDSYKITRRIILKKKYLRSENMKQFPKIMESIEQALQLVTIFSR